MILNEPCKTAILYFCHSTQIFQCQESKITNFPITAWYCYGTLRITADLMSITFIRIQYVYALFRWTSIVDDEKEF